MLFESVVSLLYQTPRASNTVVRLGVFVFYSLIMSISLILA
jgi:hypothetical protein